jgi:hypothetical protein
VFGSMHDVVSNFSWYSLQEYDTETTNKSAEEEIA